MVYLCYKRKHKYVDKPGHVDIRYYGNNVSLAGANKLNSAHENVM